MKHELLYQTVEEFNTKEGDSGNITSVTPGVGYIVETGSVPRYNRGVEMIVATYKPNDPSSPTKLYHSSGFKNAVKRVFIDNEEIPVSSLTETYQFQGDGHHIVKYIIPEAQSFYYDKCFSGCTEIENLRMPKKIMITGGAINQTGNGNGTLKIYGNLAQHVNSRNEFYYKHIIVYGWASTYYSISTKPCVETIRISKQLWLDDTGAGVNYCYGPASSLKFLEVGGDISSTSGSRKIFMGTGATHYADGIIIHLYRENAIAADANVCCASHSRIGKFYVGDGSSEEHDRAILQMYLDDSTWQPYANKLDLWYNYHGEYRQE